MKFSFSSGKMYVPTDENLTMWSTYQVLRSIYTLTLKVVFIAIVFLVLYSHIRIVNVDVVVNFLSQLICTFPLFLWMFSIIF